MKNKYTVILLLPILNFLYFGIAEAGTGEFAPSFSPSPATEIKVVRAEDEEDKPINYDDYKPDGGCTPIELAIWKPAQLPWGENRDVYGFRISLFYGRNRDIYGLDLGLFYSEARDVVGIRFAPAGIARNVTGIEIMGGNTAKVSGLKIGILSFLKSWELGDISGIQIGDVNDARDVVGAQIGGLGNSAYGPNGLKGIQIGGGNLSKNVAGVQFGVLGNSGDNVSGIQIGSMENTVQNLSGAQIGAIYNSASNNASGVQLDVFMNEVGGNMKGIQFGGINIAKKVKGVQIGVVNYCEQMSGIQLGAINMITYGGLPFFPVINASATF